MKGARVELAIDLGGDHLTVRGTVADSPDADWISLEAVEAVHSDWCAERLTVAAGKVIYTAVVESPE